MMSDDPFTKATSDAHGSHPHSDGPRHQHGPHGHDHPGGFHGWVQSLFRPHSHDASDSLDDALAGSDEGTRVVKLSLLGLAATALLQLAVVLLSGSVALLADTIHNFADASTALPLWLAFSLGRRAANSRYTYGYGRAEDLAGIFVVLMIAGSSCIAAWEALQRLLHPETLSHLEWVAVAGLLGFIGNEVAARDLL